MPPPFDDMTHDRLERSLAELDLHSYIAERHAADPVQPYYPSPAQWQDQVLYFLMVDRFSDGNEQGVLVDAAGNVHDAYRDNDNQPVPGGSTALFRFPQDAYTADFATWSAAGRAYCGGTLRGLHSKLGYLQRMGITTLWISPVFKQVEATLDPEMGRLVPANMYHGYGAQNFLDINPRFGTRRDLKELVAEAHRLGIYVLLDIIFNHAGDVFQYDADRYSFDEFGQPLGTTPDGAPILDARWDGREYAVRGYRAADGAPSLPFGPLDLDAEPQAWPDGAIWPAELQVPETFTRRGRISNYDHDPEFLEGDFVELKDIDHGQHPRAADGSRVLDAFTPSAALRYLAACYKFWIAYADIDGYRIDTVKHMEIGATRFFASVIREFAESVGKENFLLLGEITGGRVRAFETLEYTGLDAALGIDDVADKLEFLSKGRRNPQDYFDLFRNSEVIGKDSHTWFGRHVVTMFDDHDRVGRSKTRFSGDTANRGYDLLVPALALNLLSMGIPCLYYGTEQGFDGSDRDYTGREYRDTFLRECMFGGPFGSLRSTGRHFFNESHPAYRAIARLSALRRQQIALRRGRQFLRPISDTGDEGTWGLPRMLGGEIRAVVPWSRIFNDQELLVAINTDPDNDRRAWVTIDDALHQAGATLTCLYSTDEAIIGQTVTVAARNGKAVELALPPAGAVVYG